MAPNERSHVDRGQAQAAYSALDVEASARAHASRVDGGHDEAHSKVGGQLKTIVFGGLDGILTSFAIVSSCAGSGLTSRVVLLLGACNILADAMAMGVGEYLSTKSSDEYARRERAREDWELRNHPEGEVEEMVEIYVQRGMSREDAQVVISTMAKYHDFFVDVMMVRSRRFEVLRCLHFIGWTRGHRTMTWVVSFSILMLRAGRGTWFICPGGGRVGRVGEGRAAHVRVVRRVWDGAARWVFAHATVYPRPVGARPVPGGVLCDGHHTLLVGGGKG